MGREDHPAVWLVECAVVPDPVAAAGALEARRSRAGRAGRAGGGSGRGRPSAGCFRAASRGFWTTNGSMAAPRKPAPIGRAADADDVRQVELALAQLAGHGAADVRVLDRGRRHVAGVELVGRALVVAFLVGHRPHQGDVLHDLGRLVPALGDRDPGNGRGDRLGLAAVLGARLGVERLELARAAGHPEQDAGHLPLAQLGGLERHPVGEAQRDRRRRGQARRPQADRPEEMAAADHALAVHRHLHHLLFECHGSASLFLTDWEGMNGVVSTERDRETQRRVMNSVELIRLQ